MSTKSNFKTLQKEWYAKLKESGFNDIETNLILADGNEGFNVTTRYTPDLRKQKGDKQVYFERTQLHYQKARVFLHDHNFESSTDKFIWELYSEGVSYREIANRLKEIGVSRKKDYVLYTIKKLNNLMKDIDYDDEI